MNISTCLAMHNALSSNRYISTKRSSDSISENYEKYEKEEDYTKAYEEDEFDVALKKLKDIYIKNKKQSTDEPKTTFFYYDEYERPNTSEKKPFTISSDKNINSQIKEFNINQLINFIYNNYDNTDFVNIKIYGKKKNKED